jgi:hypothetical protein
MLGLLANKFGISRRNIENQPKQDNRENQGSKGSKDCSNDRDSTGDTGMIHGKVATHNLRKFIVSSILQPTYVEDIQDVLKGRYRWRKVSMIMFVIYLVATFIANALIFYSAYDNSPLITLIAGIVNILASAFVHFSSVAKAESKRLTQQANEILKKLGIDEIPDIESDKDNKQQEIDGGNGDGNGNGSGTGLRTGIMSPLTNTGVNTKFNVAVDATGADETNNKTNKTKTATTNIDDAGTGVDNINTELREIIISPTSEPRKRNKVELIEEEK